MLRPIVGTISLAVLLALCPACPGPAGFAGPPPTDTCDTAEAGNAPTAVDVGATDALVPFEDDVVVPTISGGQGSDMVGLRLFLDGEGIATCVPQTTQVLDDSGGVMFSETRPLATYARTGGGRLSGEIWWVLGGWGSALHATVHVEVLGATVDRPLWIGSRGVSPPPPTITLQALTPESSTAAVDDRLELTLALDEAAPAGITTVTLTSTAFGVARVSSRETFDCPTCPTDMEIASGIAEQNFYVDVYRTGTADIVATLGDSVVRATIDVP